MRPVPAVPSVISVRLESSLSSSLSSDLSSPGDLSHSELQLHVNSAHLDFLSPESEEKLYLEEEGDSDWGSLWELDKVRQAGSVSQETQLTLLPGGRGARPHWRVG